MKLIIVLSVFILSLTSMVFALPYEDGKSDAATHQSYGDRMMGMTFADDGFVQIGDDGVVRSWNGEGEVVDYVRLDNAELLDSLSAVARVQDEAKLVEAYSRLAMVNGYSVPDAEVFNPPAHIKPSRFTDVSAMEKRTTNTKTSVNPTQVLGKRQKPGPEPPLPAAGDRSGDHYIQRYTVVDKAVHEITMELTAELTECEGLA
ncbi:hypothetical protein LTR37_007046 [Vermiconidia calcicola]|uniref:Uncharacterized protein n=1 Tax=Vermiconidia calcicola TaxID=1690605 RepID=A0ACC3NEW4_9PEZI|nr:hypothetical protein LTR37_007046 [Vermiconidia calcicola]